MNNPPPVVFVAGPTASGKSALALHLALMLDAEVVSADAYQVYQGMPVLTAAPETVIDGVEIPHHMIGVVPVSQSWNASDHYRMASAIIQDIRNRGKRVVVVGGSGLYLKFLTHGMSEAPPADEGLRKSFARRELADMIEELRSLDPEGAAMTDCDNRRYVERNLEIVLLGGKPLAYWKNNWQREPNGPGWALNWNVDELDKRIALRAAHMIENGVVDEVARLGPCSPTAERTLGLRQVKDCLAGAMTRDECTAQIALATRQYAKRQRTWLRREKWFNNLEVNSLSSFYDLAAQVKKVIDHAPQG